MIASRVSSFYQRFWLRVVAGLAIWSRSGSRTPPRDLCRNRRGRSEIGGCVEPRLKSLPSKHVVLTSRLNGAAGSAGMIRAIAAWHEA